MRDSAAGPIGTGMMLAMLGFALVWLVELPFEVAALWWDRRHDVSRVSYAEVIFGGWFALGVQFVFLCVAVLVVMGLARLVGDRWWIPGSAFFACPLRALHLHLAVPRRRREQADKRAATTRNSSPAPNSTPTSSGSRTGGRLRLPVRVQDVHGDTSAANAFTVGFGPTRKVFIWDTLLDGRFSRGEVDFVFAHELGHQARKHLIKAIGWYALFTIPFAYIVMLVTRRRGGSGGPRRSRSRCSSSCC